MSAFSSVARFARGLFGSEKSSSPRSSSVSKRRYGSPKSVPASKKSVTRTSAERKKNRSNLINRLAREKREQRKKEHNERSPMPLGQVGKRHNTGEPFHMPTNRFNSNMGSLRTLKKQHRNPANIVKYMQKYAVQERLAGR
jgi:hypothetical protein